MATECYGSALDNRWARDLLISHIQKKISIIQKLILLYTDLIAKLRARSLGSLKVASCWEEDNKN
ncbi:MAG: hypothetical protein NUV80_00925 [Candidatus Berkelbacteria bacterium]|nr:hypothetical protein [Candidatus Berkelbacteria bacterium]